MEIENIQPNPGKNIKIEVDGQTYARYPIKTKVVNPGDNLAQVIKEYAGQYLKQGDLIFLSEKMVSISQGRAIPIKDIKVSRLANFLLKFVYKSPFGVGIGSPWTMELAIRETGAARILLAAFASAITKPLGIRGVFYKVAEDLKKQSGYDAVILDANDIGIVVMGKSNKEISDDFCKKVFKDNPLGQTSEQTPVCVVRKI